MRSRNHRVRYPARHRNRAGKFVFRETRFTQRLLWASAFNALDNKLFTILEIASRSTRAHHAGFDGRSMLIPPTSNRTSALGRRPTPDIASCAPTAYSPYLRFYAGRAVG